MAISSQDVARGYDGRAPDFQDLMREQVRNILFVSSLYESFILSEDGQLNELMLSKFLDLNLSRAPSLTQVASGAEALGLADSGRTVDLIITSVDVGDMDALELTREVRGRGLNIPVVVLAYDHRELTEFMGQNDLSELERIFVWQGDARILLAIVKYVEDKLNVVHDVKAGVPVFIVVEDNVRYYSSFLPVIYAEVMRLSQSVSSEGVNLYHRLQRMRARPKILLASTFEEAWSYFSAFQSNVLGVISDIEFPKEGEHSPAAGIDLAHRIRDARPDVAIALQSSHPENEALADAVDAGFFLKGSPSLLQQLRVHLKEHFFFGDFVFRLPDGTEVARAEDLRDLVETLRSVPEESIAYHAERNDFSSWLRARAEFELAEKLRPRHISEFPSIEVLRRDLIQALDEYRRERDRSTVADFEAGTYAEPGGITRIGGGSLGGKGRGLAFAIRLLDQTRLSERFPGVRIEVPRAVVLGTEIFNRFLDDNELRSRALHSESDEELVRDFLAADFPEDARAELATFLDVMSKPLAVRSSSLLEDSRYQPFAGVFDTWMLPNDHPDPEVRLDQLVAAVLRVYASTFCQRSKVFLRATPYRLEEEQMAVVIQEVVGSRHGDLFYPEISGVARSYNFYPTPPAGAKDGIAAVALGLGKTVVDGEPCLRFAPPYPRHSLDFSSVDELLDHSQREFWALRLGDGDDELDWGNGGRLVKEPLETAEAHGTLRWVGSVYSEENNAIYDGLSRTGVRLVSFAPVLKHDAFPLADVLRELLGVAAAGTGSPVEIEFAANLSPPPGQPKELAFLQLRPLAMSRELEEVEIQDVEPRELICESPAVLGNGRIDGIRDVVVVDRKSFERARSREYARVLDRYNAVLTKEGRPYLLIGVGRWGSTHSWLGIPVRWEQISGARVIVEAGFRDFRVAPSQGTHFFQNLASFNVGYFTVNQSRGEGFVDWEWLAAEPAVAEEGEEGTVRHLRFDEPLVVVMNGAARRGVVYKPGQGRGV